MSIPSSSKLSSVLPMPWRWFTKPEPPAALSFIRDPLSKSVPSALHGPIRQFRSLDSISAGNLPGPDPADGPTPP